MLTRGLVTTGVPLWYVRFDDGTFEQILMARYFVERGIDVTFALNSGTIGSGARFGWDDLNALIGIAAENGARVSVCQHSATNWSKYLVGATNIYENFNYDSYTYDDILDELDAALVKSETGIDVTGYVQPGDFGPNRFCQFNRELLMKAMREKGFEFAIGLYRGSANDEGHTGIAYTASNDQFVIDPIANLGNLHQLTAELKPGIIHDPFSMPDGHTVDIGGTVVTRGVENGTSAPLPDLNSKAPGWLLGEDNNGTGAEGSVSADCDRTLNWRLARMLGSASWTGIAMHGELRSDESNVALATGTKTYPGHFSAKHLAWILDALRADGHIRLGTAEEYAQEIFSDFAEGVDIISNRSCKVPLWEIGETSSPDMVIPRGMTLRQGGYSAASTNAHMMTGGTALNSDSNLFTAISSDRVLGNLVGPNALKVRAGMAGGMTFKADAGGPSTAYFQFPMLQGGIYRFSAEIDQVQSGNTWAVQRYGVLGSRAVNYHEAVIESEQTNPFGGGDQTGLGPTVESSGLEFCVLESSTFRHSIDLQDDLPGKLIMHFDANPALCFPQLMAASTQDPASVADGAKLALTPVTIEGAVPGARVVVRFKATPPAGVTVAATVTDINEVTATIYNNSGSAYDFGSTEFRFYVENMAAYHKHPVIESNVSPWIFLIYIRVDKDGVNAAALNDPELRLLKRY